MKKLGIEQIDLFLIHWPVPSQDKYVEAWKTLVDLQKQGADQIDRRLQLQPGSPGAHHQRNRSDPRGQSDRAASEFSAARQAGLSQTARYQDRKLEPACSGRAQSNPKRAEVGRKHGKSVAQVIIRWHLHEGLIVIPKSTDNERLEENLNVFDFELDAGDLKMIGALDSQRGGRNGPDPATAS